MPGALLNGNDFNSGRHEAQEIKQSLNDHWSAFRRLDIEASRNWILSSFQSRTMGLSSFVSSRWLHRSSGINEPRFGWSLSGDDPTVAEAVRHNLVNLCESIWQHRHGTGRRAAATGDG